MMTMMQTTTMTTMMQKLPCDDYETNATTTTIICYAHGRTVARYIKMILTFFVISRCRHPRDFFSLRHCLYVMVA